MYFQQTKIHVLVRDKENEYNETRENAETDGFIFPEMDEKYDYRVYEKGKDGSFKRHALVADHGEIHDDGGDNWQPGEDAFSDLAELCRRKVVRLKAEQEAIDRKEQERITEINRKAEEVRAKLLEDYKDA